MKRSELMRNRHYAVEFIGGKYNTCERYYFGKIDTIVWDSRKDAMVFVRVIVHRAGIKSHRLWYGRKQRVEFKKLMCKWCRVNRWRGKTRVDVVDVFSFGDNVSPVIDHIVDVKM